MAVSPPPLLMQSPLFNHFCWGIHRIEQVQSPPHWPFSLYLCHSCVLQLLTTSFFKCCDLSLTPSLLLPGTGPSRSWMSYFLCVHQRSGCCAAYFRLHPTSCSSTSPPVLPPSILGCWTGRQVCGHRLPWPSSFPVGDAKNELVSLGVLSSPLSSYSLFSQYHNSSMF